MHDGSSFAGQLATRVVSAVYGIRYRGDTVWYLTLEGLGRSVHDVVRCGCTLPTLPLRHRGLHLPTKARRRSGAGLTHRNGIS